MHQEIINRFQKDSRFEEKKFVKDVFVFFYILLRLVDLITTLLVLLVLTHVVISYFMSPYHTFRMWVDRLVAPMLSPIRRVIPLVGMFDISPIILLLLIQFIGSILKQILWAFV